MIYESNSVEETEMIAAELSQQFNGGEVVALEGDLGAGKTQFVRGLVRGLGGNPRSVSSPTFVLLNLYDTGRLKLYHLDAYRISDPMISKRLGLPNYWSRGAWWRLNGHRALRRFCR